MPTPTPTAEVRSLASLVERATTELREGGDVQASKFRASDFSTRGGAESAPDAPAAVGRHDMDHVELSRSRGYQGFGELRGQRLGPFAGGVYANRTR
jgi:hypothetical protein